MLLAVGAIFLCFLTAIQSKTVVLSVKTGLKKGKGTYKTEHYELDWFAPWVTSYPQNVEVSSEFKSFTDTASICYIDGSYSPYFFTNGTFNGDDSNVCSGDVLFTEMEIFERKTPIPDGKFITVYTGCSSSCCDVICCKPNYFFWLFILGIVLLIVCCLLYIVFKKNLCDVRSKTTFIRLQTTVRAVRGKQIRNKETLEQC